MHIISMHIQKKSINNTSTLLLNGFCTNTLFSCEPSTKNIIGCLCLPITTIEKVTLFNPKYFTPESSGVDAFAYDWFGHNNWLVPPIHLVSRCLIHMQLCRAKGTPYHFNAHSRKVYQ
jgi:hypothetical protein